MDKREQDRALNYSIIDGAFSAIMDSAVGGIFLTGFAIKVLHAQAHQIGILASLPLFASLVQIFGSYIIEKTGLDLKPFFDQYLRDIRIPVFEYYVKGEELYFRWNNCVQGFNMPLRIYINGEQMNISPTRSFKTIQLGSGNALIKVDPGYYVATLNMTGK